MKRTHAQMEARDKPKRVVNPFVLFVQDVKANVHGNHPTSRADLNRMWGEISDEKKQEIERQHARLMMAWQRDMASYVEEYPEDSDDEEETVVVKAKKEKKVKKPRDPNMPRRYQNAYFHFQNEKRKELKEQSPELTGREVQAKVSELWRALSDEDKKPYQELESVQKEVYEIAMAKYKAGLAAAGVAGAGSALASAAAAATAVADKITKKPKKAAEVKKPKKKKAEVPKPKAIEEDVEMEDADDSDEDMAEDSDEDLVDSDEEDTSEDIGSDDEEEDDDDEEEDSPQVVIGTEDSSDEDSSEEEEDDDDSSEGDDSEDGVPVTFS
mmetsp:Transcript_20479/g.78519  ORF Transcript_20479/g.78519 Transcript_20479/m.78519 type:complete len:326 (-) Transcript_20479:1815-2792(-)